MKYIEPTARDVREILRSLDRAELAEHWAFFNDKRKHPQRRRIKIPGTLSFREMQSLENQLAHRYPAHSFAIGQHFWRPNYGGAGAKPTISTVIHIHRNEELYKKLHPDTVATAKAPAAQQSSSAAAVHLTIEDIARLAGCAAEQVNIVKVREL